MLALLVVISLILITASFGGSGGGALHTVQSGFLDVLSPVETVASKILTPVHDLINAVDDVVHASSQRDQLRRELAAANKEIATLQAGKHASADAAKLQRIDSTLQLAPDGPVDATVIAQPAGVWVSNVTINAGSSAGVHTNDPVIDPDGVIGIVATVAVDSSVVTLINDPSAGVTARDSVSREIGVIGPKPGSPGELQMQAVSRPSEVKVGDLIVTAGEQATAGASFFPADVPIGVVKAAATSSSGVITVSPAADLSSLDTVQVLTAVPRP
ncbi:MAG TPA: rod shape-determining protein MreC [Solirubrobacteraceae bacterium]|nr:rod shape-determining protein MreC [Solirubrobacteraceae bacterium]